VPVSSASTAARGKVFGEFADNSRFDRYTDMVAAVFRTIFAQPDPEAVAATWDEVRDRLAARFPKIGTLMDGAKAEVLAFTGFPRAHWLKTWSTNPLSVNRLSDDTIFVGCSRSTCVRFC
jgi:hypothetical protein